MTHLYLTHPQVVIDPGVPVPDWRLSEAGQARIVALAASGALAGFDRIVTSAERKAIETGEILAAALALPLEQDADMGENDRSATGYLPSEAFEAAADAFFAEPDTSFRGWETARAAQARIVAAVDRRIATHPGARLILVGHGAVGTLLRCHLARRPIARAEDQTGGQGGCIYRFDWPDCVPPPRWAPCESLIPDAA